MKKYYQNKTKRINNKKYGGLVPNPLKKKQTL